jgi:NodT family efflux transporter outer membrane factor (OMF) lipoprotein
MKHVIARAIACSVMLLVLPSCGIPPLRQAEPGPALPETFNGAISPEASSQLGIQEFYNDPLLIGLIDQALTNNRELKILNEDVVIAANEILARSGAYLPFFTAGPLVGLNRASKSTIEGAALADDPFTPGHFFTNPHGNYLIGLNLTWQIDIYRQLRNARDAAGQRYVEAIERRYYFTTRLVADVAENYYRLMGLDKRLENLDQIIRFLEQGLEMTRTRKEFARDTELAVLRFEAEVARNRSEKLIINQDIIEAENRINFLLNRYPQRVERVSEGFFDMNINTLSLGVPSQLLQNRPDIRQAERELSAAGLDIKVARANFYPQLILNGGVGLNAFNPAHLFEPGAVLGDIAGTFIGPLVNRRAIKAQYLTNNAKQRQAVYDYQRTILNAFTEVINRITMVQNYSNSVEIKKQQMASLQKAVQAATDLYLLARAEYLDVLTVQRDLRDARMALIDTKVEQLSAIVRTYQALGGGTMWSVPNQGGVVGSVPYIHTVRNGENFWTIARVYYHSGRYYKALWAANKNTVPAPDRLTVGDKLIIPRLDQLDCALIEGGGPEPPDPNLPAALPAKEPATVPPPPSALPGPFEPPGTEKPEVKPTDPNAPAVAAETSSALSAKEPATVPPAPASLPGPVEPEGTEKPDVKPTGDSNVPAVAPEPAAADR